MSDVDSAFAPTPVPAPWPSAAELYAAMSGPFEPGRALESLRSSEKDPDVLAMAATRLAEICDTSPARGGSGGGSLWLMRTPTRHTLLGALVPTELRQQAETMRAAGPDPETADLLDVLLDESPLSRQDIASVVTARHDRALLERIIVALDRAGDVAPARNQLQPARWALAELQRSDKRQRVADRGFFGRDLQLAEIAQWLSQPVNAPPVTCLFVSGGPGIGKSTLLAEAVRRHCDTQKPLVLRLDFDRAGLDVQDLRGLTVEAARQLAEQLGDKPGDPAGTAGRALWDERMLAAEVEVFNGKSNVTLRQSLPEALVTKLGEAVAAAGRQVLVVIDTLEVLRGRGQTHPVTLFHWLDSLVRRGVKPMLVLAAGRGDILDSLRQIGPVSVALNVAPSPSDASALSTEPARVRLLKLPGLEDDAAKALLARLEAPPALWDQLLNLAQGNPLKLRLAAEIANRVGAGKLPARRRDQEVDAAFLYRFLLSRIEEPELRRLAHPGLIVRRINADLIRGLLAPKLGLGRISQARAEALLEQLATQHWLVQPDPGAPGFLKHRSDMRSLLLPLQYRSAPKQSARIDAAAIGWFAALPHPWAQVEAVYHQLQLTRNGSALPSVPFNIAAQFDTELLDELPRAAADQVRAMRGERTSRFRGQVTGGIDDDPGFLQEILAVVQRQDWTEGAHMVRGVVEAGGLDMRSQAADAIRTFFWRSGQWAEARRWLTERDRFDASDKDLAKLPDPILLARLEMRAEFDPDALRRSWRDWHVDRPRLLKTALHAGDTVARYGTLAFLLAHMPRPFQFLPTNRPEADVVGDVTVRWIGEPTQNGVPAEYEGVRRLESVGWLEAEGVAPERKLSTLTPYSALVINLSVIYPQKRLRERAKNFAAAIAEASGLDGELPKPVSIPDERDPIAWVTDFGLFAEWVEAEGFVSRDANLRLIARAAERWRRTVSGNWSMGPRPKVWENRPPLDDALTERLSKIAEGHDPVARARHHLAFWSKALQIDLLPLLRRRLKKALSKAPSPAAGREALEHFTKRLLVHGTPAAFAPALAVLAVHQKLERSST